MVMSNETPSRPARIGNARVATASHRSAMQEVHSVWGAGRVKSASSLRRKPPHAGLVMQ